MLMFLVKGILWIQAPINTLYISSVCVPLGSRCVPGTGARARPSLTAELFSPDCVMMLDACPFPVVLQLLWQSIACLDHSDVKTTWCFLNYVAIISSQIAVTAQELTICSPYSIPIFWMALVFPFWLFDPSFTAVSSEETNRATWAKNTLCHLS